MNLPRLLTRITTLGLVALVATTAVAAGDLHAMAAPGDQPLEAERLKGTDRYATAARIAIEGFPDGADTAVIARGDDFPDGLAASSLAAALGGPILLTEPGRLPLVTQEDAFGALGTQRVVIVGGEGAVGPNVEARLKEILGDDNVDRIGGSDRFQTAAFVAAAAEPAGAIGDVSGESDRGLTTAIVASGRAFPDALAAGPLAHAARLPILLTERDTLPRLTQFRLETGIEQVIVVGGGVAVSTRVADEIRAIDGVEVVHRLAGEDRTDTAAALARLTREQLGWPHRAVAVSLGRDFPDALSLAPTASRRQAPILLTATSSRAGDATLDAIRTDCATLQSLVIAGGEVAVDATAEQQLEEATVCPDGG